MPTLQFTNNYKCLFFIFIFIICDFPNDKKMGKTIGLKVLHEIIRFQEISLAFCERKIFILTLLLLVLILFFLLMHRHLQVRIHVHKLVY